MNKPEIKKLRHIDTNHYLWCDEAVLIKVSGGKGAITSIRSEYDSDYYAKSQLLLNGKPILQGNYPACPTCSALLARGYGIENTNTKELQIIRDKINSDYTDIDTAIDNISPLLGLLKDGYYVIADTKLYPTAGDTHFFANAPDELTINDSSCNGYYNHIFYTVEEGFPAYIYPSQSNKCFVKNRAEMYLPKISKANSPRAIAYYNDGFISVLLDGHHKAYAAALMGVQLRTLVIIRMTGVYKSHVNSVGQKACFSSFTIPVEEIPDLTNFPPVEIKDIQIEDFTNIPISEDDLHLECYPTIEELSGYYAADLQNTIITDEIIHRWLNSEENVDHYKIKYSLRYFEHIDFETACRIARTVISRDNNHCNEKADSFRILLKNKTPETEQLFIEYIINHNPNDTYWSIANSYWS